MAEIKTFTHADLASHNTKDNLYLAIHGKVYDCSGFIDEARMILFCMITSSENTSARSLGPNKDGSCCPNKAGFLCINWSRGIGGILIIVTVSRVKRFLRT
jgi:hypothetical protein